MAKREESSSRGFGDWACGEPLTAQHLVVDFTPSEEIDTDFVQRKCCAFWDLVSKSPELRDLMVLPDLIQYKPDKLSSIPPESYSTNSSVSSEPMTCERTALSVLEFAEEKGVVTDTFVPRLPITCSLGPTEYHENEPTAAIYTTGPTLSFRNKGCKCELTCKSCKNRQPKGGVPPLAPEVKHLCQTMRDWDEDHPKSMEPPGRVPYLSHCLMQRNVIT